MELDNTTQQRILKEATTIFYQKGLAGARMQEIADRCGINKAMLHYYYKTKEQLFDTVFQHTATLYLQTVGRLLGSDLPLKEKLERFIDEITDLLLKEPSIPVFIIHELNQNPDRIAHLFAFKEYIDFDRFEKEVDREVKAGTIRPVKADQLFTHLVSLTVLPFMSQAILCKVLEKNQQQYQTFLKERKRELKENWVRYL
jgi:AcrR family transcriptional regulator